MYYFLNKGGKAQSIYFRFDGHRGIRHIPPIWIKLQLVPWVSCVRTRCDRYLDCPKAAPHTPRDTDTSHKADAWIDTRMLKMDGLSIHCHPEQFYHRKPAFEI